MCSLTHEALFFIFIFKKIQNQNIEFISLINKKNYKILKLTAFCYF